jgi:hypothetical protein
VKESKGPIGVKISWLTATEIKLGNMAVTVGVGARIP